ncbi:MAG: MFS transporter [Candidatus Omnitrophota bacterium]
MAHFREVLSNRNFLFLWLGQLVSNFGDRLNQMALVALVYQSHPGSEVALAKLISFTIIPVFIIGPIAGVWVDRLDRRNVMIISDVLRGALVLTIPLFIMAKQILPIYLVIFLAFSISRFFIPSKMAIIPDLVTKDKLLVANTLQDTTHLIGNVVGLLAAGFIVNIRYVGAIGGFYIDSATFFVSAALIALIAMKSGDTHHKVSEDLEAAGEALKSSLHRSIAREIKEGLVLLAKYSNMRFVMYVYSLLLAGLGAISCVIIVFVQNAFGTSTRHLGFLGTYLVCGLFFGAVLYGKLGQKAEKRGIINLSFALTGISIIAFSIAVNSYPNIFLAGAIAGLLGVMVSPVMVSMNTLTHETIPEDARGRIFSSLEGIIHLAFLIFMFVAAYAAKFVDRFWILISVGAIFTVCGAAGIFIRPKGNITCS